MPHVHKPKGPWHHRFAVRAFTLLLGILIYWLLGFFVTDIRSIEGPDYAAMEKRYVEQALLDRQAALNQQIDELARQVATQKERQSLVAESSSNLQTTINQLLDLQRISLEKSIVLSASEQANFTNSLNLFLENQRKYQEINQSVSAVVEKKQELEDERSRVERTIQERRKPAREEYDRLMRAHRLKLAGLQLAVLLPLLAAAAFLMLRTRRNLYFPLFLAFGAAALIKVTLVMHEYFPRRYFKYILILALLAVVARLLIYFLRAIAVPGAQRLIRQYTEAYERFLCPVCEYPIRIGPRRFLFWTRRTVNRQPVLGDRAEAQEPYVCPACGSTLFEPCPACRKVRHALLPYCEHCGAEKAVAGSLPQ